MKNSSFNRWTVVGFYIYENEHPDLSHMPEYLVSLTMKDGSFLEYNLVHSKDYFVLPRISSWMSNSNMRVPYGFAKNMKAFLNPDPKVRCRSFIKDLYQYQKCMYELIRVGLRFGHRLEKL